MIGSFHSRQGCDPCLVINFHPRGDHRIFAFLQRDGLIGLAHTEIGNDVEVSRIAHQPLKGLKRLAHQLNFVQKENFIGLAGQLRSRRQ